MGPAPMIRMVEMSVLLGIKSRGNRELGTKKGRACCASLDPQRQVTLARGWSLDQIPHPRKGLKGPINRHFGRSESLERAGESAAAARARLRSASYGGAAFVATDLPSRSCGSSEGWRPGLDLNQDKERCTALAWTHSATGPPRS